MSSFRTTTQVNWTWLDYGLWNCQKWL